MATIPITANDGFQGGRVTDQPEASGKSYLRFASVLTTDTYAFQFSQAAGVSTTFGIARSIFVDNALNNFALSIFVQATAQTFPVPANATGWFPVDALSSSTIEITSAGASTGAVEVIFYNYDRTASPFVYYKFGAATTAVTMADGADVTQGAVADAAVTNPAASGSVIALLKGIITKLNTATVGTAVTIADGADVALGATTSATVTNPSTNASLISFIRGVLTGINTSATALGNILTQATASAASLVNIDTDTTTIATNTSNTNTSVQSVVTNTSALSFSNITTSTTTVVKGTPGVVGKITVNSAGGAGSIVLYNNTVGSGAVIATLDSTVIGSFDYNVTASIGITVVTTGAPDITVTYR